MYFANCLLQVCATAKKRKPFLGLIYDKLARKQWEQRASHNEDGFDVNIECRKLDNAILLEAQDEHDKQVSEPKAPPQKDWPAKENWHSNKTNAKGSYGKRKFGGHWESDDKRARW